VKHVFEQIKANCMSCNHFASLPTLDATAQQQRADVHLEAALCVARCRRRSRVGSCLERSCVVARTRVAAAVRDGSGAAGGGIIGTARGGGSSVGGCSAICQMRCNALLKK
jgi:hypothetical protein